MEASATSSKPGTPPTSTAAFPTAGRTWARARPGPCGSSRERTSEDVGSAGRPSAPVIDVALAGGFFDRALETTPAVRLRRGQWERLRAGLSEIWASNPFWRGRLEAAGVRDPK